MDMVNLPFLVDSSPQRFWGTAPQDVGSHWGSPTYQQHTSLHRGYHWPYTTSSRGWRGWGAGCHFRWRGLHLKRHMGCCWKFVLIKIDLQWLWFIHDYMTCNIYYLYHIYIYISLYMNIYRTCTKSSRMISDSQETIACHIDACQTRQSDRGPYLATAFRRNTHFDCTSYTKIGID